MTFLFYGLGLIAFAALTWAALSATTLLGLAALAALALAVFVVAIHAADAIDAHDAIAFEREFRAHPGF